MEWNSIQRDAQSKGVLVYAISQAQTPPVTQPGPWGVSGQGYCMGLAANWIALACQGKDFASSGQVCDDPPWQSTMAQNVYDDADSTDWVGEWKIILAPFSCTVTGHKAERAHPPSAAFLCQTVLGATGCHAVTLARPGGGHAVAFCNANNGRLHLFDPNYFHVVVKGAEAFQSFVGWWLEQTGYDKRYTEHTGVVGIRPPINHSHR